MPLILRNRESDLIEIMDQPDCNQAKLYNTYQQFSSVNRLVSRWHTTYHRFIRPLLSPDRPATLLDIGFGGADVPLYLDYLARKDGFKLTIAGIETDPRALEYTASLPLPDTITLHEDSVDAHASEGNTYDIVISNHLLHHLSPEEIHNLLAESEKLAGKRVVFNDIERGDFAWLGFNITYLFYRNSFITADGLTSIRRSFTKKEIQNLLPEGWQVSRLFPYRVIIHYDTSV